MMVFLLDNICNELGKAWTILGYVIWLIQIVTPLLLIISGMLTMAKAVMQDKQDGLEKATSELITKIISALIVFLVIWATKLVVNLIADDGWQDCAACVFNPGKTVEVNGESVNCKLITGE